MYLHVGTDRTYPQHPFPLFTDILQYYLACSPRATNPFQQVRARLVLGGQCQGHRMWEESERAMGLAQISEAAGPLGAVQTQFRGC